MINHVPILFKERFVLSRNIYWLYYWLILVAISISQNLYLTFASKTFTTVAESSNHSQLRKTLTYYGHLCLLFVTCPQQFYLVLPNCFSQLSYICLTFEHIVLHEIPIAKSMGFRSGPLLRTIVSNSTARQNIIQILRNLNSTI